MRETSDRRTHLVWFYLSKVLNQENVIYGNITQENGLLKEQERGSSEKGHEGDWVLAFCCFLSWVVGTWVCFLCNNSSIIHLKFVPFCVGMLYWKIKRFPKERGILILTSDKMFLRTLFLTALLHPDSPLHVNLLFSPNKSVTKEKM